MDEINKTDEEQLKCVITSSLENMNNTQTGKPNHLSLSDLINQRYQNKKVKPLLAFITPSNSNQELINRGFQIYNNNNEMVENILSFFKKNGKKVKINKNKNN